MSIQVLNTTKVYGDQKALDQIAFSIKKGEIVGFLGPNGAGKSTMMKILTTYLKADSGSVMVNNFDVTTQGLEVQKSVGYLPEHNPLYLDMYVREYLEFNANMYKVDKKKIEAVINKTGLSPEAHKKITALSKGYRQRLGLAAAILHDPEVLILDEPTTGLDPNQLIDMRKLIKDLGQEKTVLLSTHIMQEVEAMCDRVIIINKGSIVANEPLNDFKQLEEQLIEVEFDYRVEEVLLKSLPNIKSVKNIHDFQYELVFNTKTDMRSSVFDFAHDNKLKILKLDQKSKNLERLFRELTAN